MTPPKFIEYINGVKSDKELSEAWKDYRKEATIKRSKKTLTGTKTYYMRSDEETEKWLKKWLKRGGPDVRPKPKYLYKPHSKMRYYLRAQDVKKYNKRLLSGDIKNIFNSQRYYMRKRGYSLYKNGTVHKIKK